MCFYFFFFWHLLFQELRILTSKSAANMSSDSVNMSGAEGFFALTPETNKNTAVRGEFLIIHHVVKQNIWNMCLIHILCRAQNMLQVAETARLWITSQQLNEHMTERNNIKIPASNNSVFLTQIKPFLFCAGQYSLAGL